MIEELLSRDSEELAELAEQDYNSLWEDRQTLRRYQNDLNEVEDNEELYDSYRLAEVNELNKSIDAMVKQIEDLEAI